VKGIYNYLGVLISDFGSGFFSLGCTYFFNDFPEVVTFIYIVMTLVISGKLYVESKRVKEKEKPVEKQIFDSGNSL
jgi:4-hydroxybenzoate polyprenyltransferase